MLSDGAHMTSFLSQYVKNFLLSTFFSHGRFDPLVDTMGETHALTTVRHSRRLMNIHDGSGRFHFARILQECVHIHTLTNYIITC